ncbi:MAG TPA: glycosyltransferase, partial [Ottowia sp.]|nr:glycosyltransferase [Ottowia sp.]
MPALLEVHPGIRLFVAGPGDASDLLKVADPRAAAATVMLGMVTDDDKASLLRSVDAYVAPHLGGESFGIVLVEAMAAGAPVVASDLPAFPPVLDAGATPAHGDANGILFETGAP